MKSSPGISEESLWEKAKGTDRMLNPFKGNGMKCPECSGGVRFRGTEITCSECGWHPPDDIMKAYGLVPLTNTRIVLGSVTVFAIGLTLFAIHGAAAFLILGFVGLASAPFLLAYRSWYVDRVLRDYQGIQ